MDSKFIIQKGDVAKYRVTITCNDFSQTANDFYVLLSFGMTGKTLKIMKSEMFTNEENNYYFAFRTDDMVGMICAECHYFVPDTDFDSGIREDVDYQLLGFVTSDPCPTFPQKCTCSVAEDNPVQYKRIFASDANTAYLYVRTSEQSRVMTSDGKNLRVHKIEEVV